MQRWLFKRREDTASQRAIDLRGCAWATITVLQFAMLKASLVATVGDSVDAVSAPGTASCSHFHVSGIQKLTSSVWVGFMCYVLVCHFMLQFSSVVCFASWHRKKWNYTIFFSFLSCNIVAASRATKMFLYDNFQCK